MPTLSVISPVYNEEAAILPFLESLCTQTCADFELLLVDDGSTDRTLELIEPFLPRLPARSRLLRHERNVGELPTVAEAFSLTSGDVCVKLDADSQLQPDTLARIVEAFADERLGAVTTLFGAADPCGWLQRGAEVLVVAQQRCDREAGGYTSMAYGTCFAFRRSMLSREELGSKMDMELSQLIRERGGRILLLEDVIVRTRFPATVAAAFARGRRTAYQELPAHWKHKELLLRHWGFWAKLAPLGLLLVALTRPRRALGGLLAWLGAAQLFLAWRTPDYALADRLAAWGVTVVRWSGFDVELLRLLVRGAASRLGRGRDPGL